MEKMDSSCCPSKRDINWPLHEPWRHSMQQSRCEGQGRCQGDPRSCNSKYRYSAEVACPCPSEHSVKSSSCCSHCPAECPKLCKIVPPCNKVTTGCVDWPTPMGGVHCSGPNNS